ncbi:hypothetical protein HPB48_013204 [Haemaphysalis longicornis]|uniref:Uncharacterized protein n=1 Tax=Haemaphysalis longicornis TaxID=44386 RepID=A0A9J6GVW1_HAELO|nr:hypothetical protein HPB48_013204 [Haemaphysalis longicornis]
MFLLNLNLTHFVVYSKVEPLILTIPRCDNHIDMLVRKLQGRLLQALFAETGSISLRGLLN